jgi:PAS domain S-box-containing protein
MIWAVDGQIIEANEAFLGMFGYSSEDLLVRMRHNKSS